MMQKATVSNFIALKGYKRFSELSKLIIAAFSAILIFSCEKITCLWMKLPVAVIALIGVSFAAIALMGFSKSADEIEMKIDELSDKDQNQHEVKKYKNQNTSIDKFSQSLYKTAIVLLAVLAIITFIVNPILCAEKEVNNHIIKNVINK